MTVTPAQLATAIESAATAEGWTIKIQVPSTGLSRTNIPMAVVTGCANLLGGGGTQPPRCVGITVDGGTSVLTSGTKGFVQCPFAGTISRWTLVADAVGSLIMDVWKCAFALAPPTDTNRIAGTEKPTLASAQTAEDTTLSSWTTAVAAGDVFGFEIEGTVASIRRVTLQIWITPS